MKKIINSMLFRFKENSLAKRKAGVDRDVAYKSLAEIQSCLVFWSADVDPNECLEKLSKKIEEGVFDKLCIVSGGQEMSVNDDTIIVRDEDLGFGGKIKNEKLRAVMAKKYDLLIDLTTNPTVISQYILANSNAYCVTSMKKEGVVADIIIDGVEESTEFIDRLIELLAKIKKL